MGITTTVSKEATFDSAHRLFPYDGKCSNIHGHTYKIRCSWVSSQLHEGMVRDFNLCKEDMMRCLEEWDHKLILSVDDPILRVFQENDILKSLKIRIMDRKPTAENMALLLKEEIKCDEVTLWETPTSFVLM